MAEERPVAVPAPVHDDDDKEDIYCFYANNVQFETNVWDFKFRFGQLSNRDKEWETDPRCEVTIPWMQAKILLFYLALNVFNYEEANGVIKVPDFVKPVPPEVVANPADERQRPGQDFINLYQELYERLFPK